MELLLVPESKMSLNYTLQCSHIHMYLEGNPTVFDWAWCAGKWAQEFYLSSYVMVDIHLTELVQTP